MIDWSASALAILRRIRALAPAPGAATTFRGQRLKVLSARPASSTYEFSTDPGLLVIGKDVVSVGTADLPIELAQVQPEGRRRMSGAEFVRGYRPEPGERLA